ncbi:MAG: SPOR domain-containing protein [Bacteroidales bacterium]|nr:SPOR domain-containing protein [Bacteroidales bacterium]
MNITSFIVEILQSGKNVEIKGVGTFSPHMVEAYHDTASGVFYPKRQSVAFSNDTVGDESIIDAMAKHECVDRDIAEKMWQSYIDALMEKLQKKGSHDFSGMGTLVRCADGYAFTVDPAFDLSGAKQTPIQDVKIYDTDEEDPFANYEQPMQMVDDMADEPVKQPKPLPQRKTSHDGTAAQPAEASHTPSDESTTATTTPDNVTIQEIEEQEQMPTTDATSDTPTPTNEDETDKTGEPVSQPIASDSEDNKETTETESNGSAAIVNDNMTVDHDNPSTDETMTDDSRSTLDVLDSIPNSDGNAAPATDSSQHGRKKSRTWLWILLAILLFLLAAGSYFYFIYRPANGGTTANAIEALKSDIASIRGGGSEMASSNDEESDENLALASNENTDMSTSDDEATVLDETMDDDEAMTDDEATDADRETSDDNTPAATETTPDDDNDETAAESATTTPAKTLFVEQLATPFTLSANLVSYDQNDIKQGVQKVARTIDAYISRFLAARNYTNAKAPMMDRIASYAGTRFAELYNPNVFYADRFLAADDYIHDFLYQSLKKRREHQTCITIQSEIMDYGKLDQMLQQMVAELGLKPDAPRAAATKPAPFKNVNEIPSAQCVKASKQGYDIVAGFYTNKTSANRMAWILKRQGCDAYIIDKQGLYYVSMGSAPTQTAADALYKHIKSWYDGDIAIRKL